jgi:DNA-directed RNA polymerase specialized sigma subunit
VGKGFYQLSFLRDTDGEKTIEAVEAALEKYRMYMLTVPDECDANVLSRAAKQDEYMERIRRAVNKLNAIEREIIIKRHMSLEEPRDYDIYNEMGISESTFYRILEKAFYKLAFALRIEVYKEVKSEVISYGFCSADSRSRRG